MTETTQQTECFTLSPDLYHQLNDMRGTLNRCFTHVTQFLFDAGACSCVGSLQRCLDDLPTPEQWAAYHAKVKAMLERDIGRAKRAAGL